MKLSSHGKKQRKEEILIVFLALAFVLILTFVLIFINMFPMKTVKRSSLPVLPISVSFSNGEKTGTLLGSDENGGLVFDASALSAGENTLTVSNSGKDKVKITIVLPSSASVPSSGKSGEGYTLSGKTLTSTLEEGGVFSFAVDIKNDDGLFLPDVTVSVNDSEICCVSKADSLKKAADNKSCASIVLLSDIDLPSGGDLVFTRCCALFCLDHALTVGGNVILDTSSEGTFQITAEAGKITSSGFFANAPDCAVIIDEPFFEVTDDIADYYIKAWNYNGKKMNTHAFPVKSTEMLSALADTGSYPKLFDGATVSFIAPMALERDIVLSSAVSLEFFEDFETRFHTVSIVSNASERIFLRDKTSSGIDHTGFIYDTPNCDLSWTGRSAPGNVYVSEMMNVATYGGTDIRKAYGIGGYCMGSITDFVIRKYDNPKFKEDVIFIVTGNVLIGYTSDYSIDTDDLKSVGIYYKLDGCSLSFPSYMRNEDGTIDLSYDPVCIITDTYGNSKTLRIKLRHSGKDIPVININVSGGVDALTKTDYQNAVISIDPVGRYGFEQLYDTEVLFRGRGNSTWEKFDKKPYRLHFNEDISIFGLPSGKNWVLLANHTDKSLMRNHVANFIAASLDNLPYAATQYCVDLFVNGEYKGVYTIGENIEVSETRIPLINTGLSDTGFLIEVGGVDSDIHTRNVDYFHAGLITFALVKYPDSTIRTAGQVSFIKNYFKKTDSAIKAKNGYEEYLDIDSTIDWLILHELSNNIDSSFRRSCYFTKQPGEKLMMGPAWDFDIAFGNFIEDDPDYDTWACYTYHDPEETNVDTSDDYVGTTWGKYLLEDKSFVERFRNRWMDIKDKLIASALEEIDLTAADVAPSAKENFRVWNVLNIRLPLERKDVTKYNTFDKQVTYLKNFIITRSEWMTSKLDEMMSEFERQ